jgi:hypothetical protein
MTKAQKRKRHAELSWRIIEWKLMYYYPEMIDEKYHEALEVPDDIYDAAEEEYIRLCLELKLPNTVAHKWSLELDTPELHELSENNMIEPDLTRPSVQLVLSKYGVTT